MRANTQLVSEVRRRARRSSGGCSRSNPRRRSAARGSLSAVCWADAASGRKSATSMGRSAVGVQDLAGRAVAPSERAAERRVPRDQRPARPAQLVEVQVPDEPARRLDDVHRPAGVVQRVEEHPLLHRRERVGRVAVGAILARGAPRAVARRVRGRDRGRQPPDRAQLEQVLRRRGGGPPDEPSTPPRWRGWSPRPGRSSRRPARPGPASRTSRQMAVSSASAGVTGPATDVRRPRRRPKPATDAGARADPRSVAPPDRRSRSRWLPRPSRAVASRSRTASSERPSTRASSSSRRASAGSGSRE